jgi:hypothetical protein
MISKYNSFSLDLLLEKAINESMIYFSPDLRKQLGKLSGDISSDLLEIEATDIKPDITFIDLDKEGFLSFSTMRNVKKILDEKFPDIKDKIDLDNKPNKGLADDVWYIHDKFYNNLTTNILNGMGNFDDGLDPYVKSRNQIAIGRLVNKIFPGKYNSKQVEDFVNSFKAVVEKSGEHFELVEGDEIEYWYWYENYKVRAGALGTSCMAQKRGLFRIYTQNQDVCKLLILKEDDKIIGRSLIWKLKSINIIGEDPGYFMDRQYTIKESDVQKFKNYAKEQGWFYKSSNNHHSFGTVNINGVDKNIEMTVEVNAKDYGRYPYMDTFRRYDVDNGILHNDDERESDYEDQYILESTDGSYEIIEGGVYSEWYDRRIPEHESVWSEPLSDHLYEERAVRVERGNSRRQGWYPDDYEEIFYDDDLDEYIHENDGVWSSIEDRMLYDGTAVVVVMEIFDDGDVPSSDDQYLHEDNKNIKEIDTGSIWYDKISDTHRDWRDYEHISQKLLTIDYEDNYIPKAFATEIYKIDGPRENAVDINGIKYLSKADSLVLGYTLMEESVDGDEKRIIDWFTYTETISEYTDIILERLPKLIKRYDDVLNNTGQLQLQFKENEQEYRDKVSLNRALCQDRLYDLEKETWN